MVLTPLEFSKVYNLSLASTAIYCIKKYQAIGVTVHSHFALRALKVFYSDVGEGGAAVNCDKT